MIPRPRLHITFAALTLPLALLAMPRAASAGSVMNSHWAGYTVSFPSPDPTTQVLGAGGSWKVPGISCPAQTQPQAVVSTWIGLGGVNIGSNVNDLEQIGTVSQCNLGKASYQAVYELTDVADSTVALPSKDAIAPGDSMKANVVDQGGGTGGEQFALQMWDQGPHHHWYYSTLWLGPGTGDPSVTPLTADWIAEQKLVGTPPVQEALPKFAPIAFTNCKWVQSATGTQQPLIKGKSLFSYTIVNGFGVGKENTGPVARNGTQFTIKWRSYF